MRSLGTGKTRNGFEVCYTIDSSVHAAEQPLSTGNVVLQLAIQIMSGSSLHGNGSRGGSGGFANIRDLLLSIALHLGDGSSVGSFHSVECRFLLLLGSGGGIAKILQGGSGGRGCCRGSRVVAGRAGHHRQRLLP